MNFEEYLIKLTQNIKRLYFQPKLSIDFVEEVFIFQKNSHNLVILISSHSFKNLMDFVITPPL